MVMTSHSPSNIVIQRPITPLTTLVVAAAAIVITLVSALTPVLLSLVLVGIAPDFTKSINSPDASIAVGLGIKAAITAPTLLVCITLCLTIGRRWFGIERRSLAWRFSPAALVWLLVMMGVAGLIAFGVGLLQDLLPATLPTDAEPAWPWWAKVVNTIILAFLLQGIPEELIWRGWVVAILGRQKSTFWITVIVFTALHLISQGRAAYAVGSPVVPGHTLRSRRRRDRRTIRQRIDLGRGGGPCRAPHVLAGRYRHEHPEQSGSLGRHRLRLAPRRRRHHGAVLGSDAVDRSATQEPSGPLDELTAALGSGSCAGPARTTHSS